MHAPALAATCILFGDGCGAVVLRAGEEGSPCSLLGMAMHSDGTGGRHLNSPFVGGVGCMAHMVGGGCMGWRCLQTAMRSDPSTSNGPFTGGV